MRVSRTLFYAIDALIQLSNAGGVRVSCKQLARNGSIPERFLLQVLRELVNAGILQSSRGVDGGYRLARQPGQIKLSEVIDAVGGWVNQEPNLPQGVAPHSSKPLSRTLRWASDATRERLASVSLLDLAEPPAEEAMAAE